MIKLRRVKLPTEIINDILCDSCGKSCKEELNFVYMELHATWGCDSNHDLEKWDAQLCEKCVEDKLGFIKFKITKYLPF